MSRSARLAALLAGALTLAAATARAEDVRVREPAPSVERQLSGDEPFQEWMQDPSVLERQAGDRLEEQLVVGDRVETVKLSNLVPPIYFESGVAKISPAYIQALRRILDSMRHLENVRLHLVGHADEQRLSERLASVYGDNAGLSRERAGEVAEFIQAALALPPEAISFEWAGDSQPIASNATAEGRARNRRVEVEVWYDELREELGVEEVVVPEEIKRVKVCRMETVCKVRYREGHERRARIRNLVAPLRSQSGAAGVPEAFVAQVAEALGNLSDKSNVTVKFVGFTDDAPLEGREERLYGNHLALSRARAFRVARAVQESLALPSSAVESEGRGMARPLASNATESGRALNRRVEVEFWHDDPLQELPDGLQPCPDPPEAEIVTRVYDPPWGRLEPLRIVDGEAVVPAGYASALRRAMDELEGRERVRLRFVGYTGNRALDRRTARVYGDDVGLSAARARRTLQTFQEEMQLLDAEVEHEGRGFVHSKDVVNAGFLQEQDSLVEVQVVYDELAILDDPEALEITPIQRELTPQHPLALNLMRISVDGVPVDDPGRSSADVQRCTDVALARTDIRFRFEGADPTPRLAVSASLSSLEVGPLDAPSVAEGGPKPAAVLFRAYSNYGHFIERSEVRVFERGASLRAEPLAVVPVGEDGKAEWRPPLQRLAAPVRELSFVLRAYDAEGRFDETAPQPLWLARPGGLGFRPREAAPGTDPDPTLSAYGENTLARQNILLGNAGRVAVHGRGIPADHQVFFAGEPVPVDASGSFVAEALLPAGMHTVEVAVLDPEGNGELFLRDLELDQSDWFYFGLADLTFAANQTNGAAEALAAPDAPFDYDSYADGRFAFFVDGSFGDDWGLTASADTREGPLEEIFSNFLDKDPQSLLRRIDSDYFQPTFGDDGTVDETAPTSGRFYAKLRKGLNHAMWGNFKLGYLENELAQVDRGLYGANVRYQTEATTRFGEKRVAIDGFAAEPGTVASRQDFRGTGGSLYFLRHQDLLVGSERLRIETRDKDSGLVKSVAHLKPTDYDIDYLQGRILLAAPLGATIDDGLLVRDEGIHGDEAWLVVQYEFSPGFGDVDALATGGQGHVWINDYLRLGAVANHNDEEGSASSLYGGELTLRKTSDSWLKLQVGRSEGQLSSTLVSRDGGFEFEGEDGPDLADAEGIAYRADLSVGFPDFIDALEGKLSFYYQRAEAGYSAPGQTALTDTDQYGGTFEWEVNDRLSVAAEADRRMEEEGLQTLAAEVDVGYRVTDRWNLSAGVRYDERQDESPTVPLTQEEGARTDGVIEVAYDSGARWQSYGFAQFTLQKSGERRENKRFGAGGRYRLSDRVVLDAEVSHGDLGPAAQIGTRYQQSEGSELYLNYSLENERLYQGLGGRVGNLVSGARTRLSDSSSVFVESRMQHSNTALGLSRAVGVQLTPNQRWSISANWENGTLFDSRSFAETQRVAGGGRVGYAWDKVRFSSGVEYRFDESEQPDGSMSERTTWLFRNSLNVQVSPSWRLLGTFDHAFSDSSLGAFFDGGFTEAVLGYAYRPVTHDRLNVLAKYTYFDNVPTTDQLTPQEGSVEFLQRSHILSLDVDYDLTSYLTLGTKYAYRLGQASLERENPEFFSNDAHLFVVRGEWRFLKNWESSLEGRVLYLPASMESRSGALITLYRYLGRNFKVGVGYNFTDFSDDLTDLSYDHQGVFFNVVGTL